MRRSVWLAALAALLGALGACEHRPSASQLAALRAEADRENDLRGGDLAGETDREIREWTLTIEGQTATGTPTTLPYPELDALADEKLRGPDQTLVQSTADKDYRGVRVATLLDRVPPAAGVTEITFVASMPSAPPSRSPTPAPTRSPSRSRPTASG